MTIKPYKIGVLFESDEWSDHKLAQEIRLHVMQEMQSMGLSDSDEVVVVELNMEDPDILSEALSCDLLISRVFASAWTRGHDTALKNMNDLIEEIENTNVTMINPSLAHRFEISKQLTTKVLADGGFKTPRVYAVGRFDDLGSQVRHEWFPCIIKPNCGGRTTSTAVLQNEEDLERFIGKQPNIEYVVQEYIEPICGYITRAELVDGNIVLVVARSVVDGLSAYHLGSTYEVLNKYSPELREEIKKAADVLSISFGSFDIIETKQGNYFIDANSVSNVSEDCTETFGIDLMSEYGRAIAKIAKRDIERRKKCFQ